MQNQKTYYLQFIAVCFGALMLSLGLSQLPNRYLNTMHFWIPTVFFAISTLTVKAILTKGDKESKEFIFKTLAMSMARLLFCMIFVFIYSLINKSDVLAFTCHFMIQYLVFTIFEISILLKYIKQSN